MNRRLCMFILAAVVTAVLGLGSCMAGDGKKEENEKPVVVVFWYSYNAVVKGAFDDLVMEFSETVGMGQGIIVEPVGYGPSNELDDMLYTSASHAIGSGPLPGVLSPYPGSAYRPDGIMPLVHLDDYFTEEGLDAYRFESLKEGVWEGDGIHRVIPVAKSTETLYLSEADWEAFAGEADTDKEMLKTWKGLTQAAGMYYEWSGGSPFLGVNTFNDFVALSAAQPGEGIRWTQGGPEFSYSRDTARRVWGTYYAPHIKGWYENRAYNQDDIKGERLTACIGSSAGVGFLPQSVTEDEKQSHPVSCQSYAYPAFQDDTPYMGQRGADMAVSVSNESHQQAAVRFLEWFIQPEQNIRFAVATRYLPVQEKTLESVSDLVSHVESRDSVQAMEQSIRTPLSALKNHSVYIRETFLGSRDMDQILSSPLKGYMNVDLETLKQRMEKDESRESVERELLDEEHFDRWYETLLKEMAGETDGQKIQK